MSDVADGIRPRFQIELHSRWRNDAPVMPQIKRVTFDGRPMVLIDPEDRLQIQQIADLHNRQSSGCSNRWLQAALRELANPKPVRIDEPGEWGVVEASCAHDGRRHQWVRRGDNWYPFTSEGFESPDDWDSLTDPVLVREGVAS